MLKKLSVILIMLFSLGMAKAQIATPSTYSFTKKVFGESEIKQVTSYLLFLGGNKVMWCHESHDNYLYPVGVGTYSPAAQTVVFSAANPMNKKISYYYSGDIKLSVKKTADGLKVTTDHERFATMVGDTSVTFKKEQAAIKPSDKLVNTSWSLTGESAGKKNEHNLYFISPTEVILDGEKRAYILVGNAAGMMTGDNPLKEALALRFYPGSDKMEGHRTGLRIREYPVFILDRKE